MPMTHRKFGWLLFLTLPLLLAGCSESALRGYGGGADEAWDDDDYYGDDDDDGAPANDGDGDDVGDEPEDEDDFLSTEPRGTDVFVFVANPSRDTVSKINAWTRDIHTIEVGDEPIQVLVSSDYQRAVTFNVGDDSVSVIDVTTDEVTSLEVREDFNFIEMSPNGRWVVAYFNAAIEEADFDIEGVRSFTEVSFVDTVLKQVHSYSVGFNPKQVQFTSDSVQAVVISDSFITVADLSTDPIGLELLDLGADPVDPPVAAEVEVTPDGGWAFIRYQGFDSIQAVHLDTGELGDLDGGLNPTDLDLTPDGTKAVVVARDSKEVRLFDTTDPLGIEPEVLDTPDNSTIGSLVLAPNGNTGLLFTTVAAEDRITFWDLDTGEMTVRSMVKPVDAVAISPDGESALIIHSLADAPDENDVFTDVYALTVVDLNTWLTNPVGLESRPTRWTTSNDGRYSLFIMESNRNVGVIDYQTRLVDDITVPSQPVHIGMMPLETDPEEALGWVSQEHELGRISFVQPYDLAVQTVTGFELNSNID
jgi:DNA-binding beta-propeller fold protein YncE